MEKQSKNHDTDLKYIIKQMNEQFKQVIMAINASNLEKEEIKSKIGSHERRIEIREDKVFGMGQN